MGVMQLSIIWVDLGGLETFSVACLGIRVMGPQVMSNIWIIGKPWYAPNACLTYH